MSKGRIANYVYQTVLKEADGVFYVKAFLYYPYTGSVVMILNSLQLSMKACVMSVNSGNLKLIDGFFAYGVTEGSQQTYEEGKTHPVDIRFSPSLLYQYPAKASGDSHKKDQVLANVSMFCFPCGLKMGRKSVGPFHDHSLPSSHSFVLTDESGMKQYVTTITFYEEIKLPSLRKKISSIIDKHRQKLDSSEMEYAAAVLEKWKEDHRKLQSMGNDPFYKENRLALEERLSLYSAQLATYEKDLVSLDDLRLPICIGVKSHWPFFKVHKNWLQYVLYNVLVEKRLQAPLERYLVNFVDEIPLPPSGKLELVLKMDEKYSLKIVRPPLNCIPIIKNFSYYPLFACLSIENIVRIVELISLESKMVFLSTHVSLLTPVMESLMHFLYPFYWQHIYIPVLCNSLIDVLQAPVPFIIGICKVDGTAVDVPEDVIIIDIDNNVVNERLIHRAHSNFESADMMALEAIRTKKIGFPLKERKKLVQRIGKAVRLSHKKFVPNDIKQPCDWNSFQSQELHLQKLKFQKVETEFHLLSREFQSRLRTTQFEDDKELPLPPAGSPERISTGDISEKIAKSGTSSYSGNNSVESLKVSALSPEFPHKLSVSPNKLDNHTKLISVKGITANNVHDRSNVITLINLNIPESSAQQSLTSQHQLDLDDIEERNLVYDTQEMRSYPYFCHVKNTSFVRTTVEHQDPVLAEGHDFVPVLLAYKSPKAVISVQENLSIGLCSVCNSEIKCTPLHVDQEAGHKLFVEKSRLMGPRDKAPLTTRGSAQKLLESTIIHQNLQCRSCGQLVHGDCVPRCFVRCPSCIHEQSIQASFFRFWISILKDYRNFMTYSKDDSAIESSSSSAASQDGRKHGGLFGIKSSIDKIGRWVSGNEVNLATKQDSSQIPDVPFFNVKDFIMASPSDHQPYSCGLICTQQFVQFLYDKSQSQDYESLLFDEAIILKRNRSKVKVQKDATPFLNDSHYKVQKVVEAMTPNLKGMTSTFYSYSEGFPNSLDSSQILAPRKFKPLINEKDNIRLRIYTNAVLRKHRWEQNQSKEGAYQKKMEYFAEWLKDSVIRPVFPVGNNSSKMGHARSKSQPKPDTTELRRANRFIPQKVPENQSLTVKQMKRSPSSQSSAFSTNRHQLGETSPVNPKHFFQDLDSVYAQLQSILSELEEHSWFDYGNIQQVARSSFSALDQRLTLKKDETAALDDYTGFVTHYESLSKEGRDDLVVFLSDITDALGELEKDVADFVERWDKSLAEDSVSVAESPVEKKSETSRSSFDLLKKQNDVEIHSKQALGSQSHEELAKAWRMESEEIRNLSQLISELRSKAEYYSSLTLPKLTRPPSKELPSIPSVPRPTAPPRKIPTNDRLNQLAQPEPVPPPRTNSIEFQNPPEEPTLQKRQTSLLTTEDKKDMPYLVLPWDTFEQKLERIISGKEQQQ
ncbi:hypothetical protein MP638_002236 [Amoeboaphelidium occidentale]|nr:hypothetical protein MP638_002236 [Amoeboaphelidium occidentale]